MDISIWTLAVTPGIILAVIIYLVDRYDREPLPLLFKIFALGAFSVFPVIVVENILLSLNIFSGALSGLYVSFIVAGFTEEYFKRLVVLRWAFNDTHFNEKLDGIVFSVFSALGFATIENISYVVFRYSNVYVGLLRGILSVPAHMLFAITMGYYLSLVKYCKSCGYEDKENYFKKSLYVPMVLHGTFNFILMLGFERYLVVFLVYIGYLWTVNIKRLREYARESRIRHREDGDEY
ncbi:Membrane proteinase PrsW, cleaves anti-sigma factor RsiW, M82 family [Peptoclostridium litorale DSM 5388]|uniref:Protease PrsW n=1 Tax=Peptoclostridium litorale DSM 5388 TaxID=1121324 RepID=A0A069REW6_PEPLI|nr:PrsW family glutamic-type intramembrane protease [Peptoclostridium litorale]KDR95574.1 protease PrsW [Peptoclostridium litorale DSM 5388]SIN98576.1 Membrane proteinase PrsW, cleaves anti-sigma factor RsiW, M82 family [Peptoclostridium litorale DSM 5388]